MAKIHSIISVLHTWADSSLQESYDNSGLQIGNINQDVTQVICTLDITEAVVLEAIRIGANLIISHHPIIFKGLKQLSGKSQAERAILLAIRHDIVLFSIHTNLDNHSSGVNSMIGEKLGFQNPKILSPMSKRLHSIEVYVPNVEINGKPAQEIIQCVENAAFNAGAGKIGNYETCAFQVNGTGFYTPLQGAKPTIGELNTRKSVEEVLIRFICPDFKSNAVIRAIQEVHPYEEMAYLQTVIENRVSDYGAGMIVELPETVSEQDFLKFLAQQFQCKSITHSAFLNKPIRKVAWCGGAGISLLPKAMAQKADVFITADIKYHEYFDAESSILIVDIGHFNSEQFTSELIKRKLEENFSTFAVLISEVNTNPMNYSTY